MSEPKTQPTFWDLFSRTDTCNSFFILLFVCVLVFVAMNPILVAVVCAVIVLLVGVFYVIHHIYTDIKTSWKLSRK